MAIPSGGGSEILNRKFYTVTSNTDTKILDGEANHIYTVLSIIITETAGNAETSTTKKIKQKGAFLQSSTHQALAFGI